MKKLLQSILFCTTSSILLAQTISVPLTKGGENSGGTILSVNVNNGYFEATSINGLLEADITGVQKTDNANTAEDGLYYESSNNSLYISRKFGARDPNTDKAYGVIIKYDITNKTSKAIVTFNKENGQRPLGSLIKSGGKLYGVTASGGTNNEGVLFSIDISTDQYTIIHQFDGTDGSLPTCPLFLHNNKLYGMGKKANNADGRLIYEYNLSTNSYSSIRKDSDTSTLYSTGLMIRNSTLYFSWNSSILKIDLTNLSNEAIEHYSGLDAAGGLAIGKKPHEYTLGEDGNWYTTFSEGGDASGTNSFGSVAKFDFSSNGNMIKIHGFQGGALGQNVRVKLTPGLISNELFGIADNGSGSSILFKLTTSGIYTVLKEFNTEKNGYKIGSQVVLGNNKFYGVSSEKGDYNSGTIWSYDLASGDFDLIETLGYQNGKSPVHGLTLNPDNSNLEFFTLQGTANQKGALNNYNLTGKSYGSQVSIANPSPNSISRSLSKPIYHNGKTFFMGVFSTTGISTYNSFAGLIELNRQTGAVTNAYPIAPDANVVNQIKTNPTSNYIQESNILYGASSGYIWKFDLSNGTYTTLHSFTTSSTDNTHSLVKVGAKIYGSYIEQGASDAIFYSLNEDGTSFTEILRENGHIYQGLAVMGSNIIAVKQNLTTKIGTMVSLDYTAGSPTFVAHNAINSSTIGNSIEGTLTVINNDVYGILNKGGTSGKGSVFKFTPNLTTPASSTISSLVSLTNATGYSGYSSEFYVTQTSLSVDNFLTKNNRLVVYPNPSSNSIHIKLDKVQAVQVFDLTGKMVLSEKNMKVINIEKLTPGIYSIKVQSENNWYRSKIIKK